MRSFLRLLGPLVLEFWMLFGVLIHVPLLLQLIPDFQQTISF